MEPLMVVAMTNSYISLHKTSQEMRLLCFILGQNRTTGSHSKSGCLLFLLSLQKKYSVFMTQGPSAQGHLERGDRFFLSNKRILLPAFPLNTRHNAKEKLITIYGRKKYCSDHSVRTFRIDTLSSVK